MKKRYLIAVLIGVSLFLGCGRNKALITKDGLEGVWKTDYPTYRDCSFALTNDLIIFAKGYMLEVIDAFLLKHIDVNYILRISKKVEKIEDVEKVLYTIHYENINGQKYKFSFYFDPEEKNITFKNQQQMAWWKEGTVRIKDKPPVRPKRNFNPKDFFKI